MKATITSLLLFFIFSIQSQSQETAFFDRTFHNRTSENSDENKREYYVKDSVIEIKDYYKDKVRRTGEFSGFTDLQNLDEFIWFNSNNQYYKSPKLKLKNRKGSVKYYDEKGRPTSELLYNEGTVKYIQMWENGEASLTNGSGKIEREYEKSNESRIRIFRDSVEIHNYVVRREKNDTLYYKTDTKAYPKNGVKDFSKYLASNIDYPKFADFLGVDKKIRIQFTVNEDGKLTDFIPLNNKSFGFEKKAIRKLERAPKWIPASINGKNVKTRFHLPITFRQ